jgi:hypothetical protein
MTNLNLFKPYILIALCNALLDLFPTICSNSRVYRSLALPIYCFLFAVLYTPYIPDLPFRELRKDFIDSNLSKSLNTLTGTIEQTQTLSQLFSRTGYLKIISMKSTNVSKNLAPRSFLKKCLKLIRQNNK